MNLKKIIFTVFLFLLFFSIGFLITKKNNNTLSIKRAQIVLGTLVEIEVVEEDKEIAEIAIKNAFNEIKRIDSLFSTYNKNSPVYKLNNSNDSILKINKEIFYLIKRADFYNKLSNGYFDASLHSLIEAWGFSSENFSIPNEKELNNALKNSGWKYVEIIDDNYIKKAINVQFNFGGIAKGYAVDKAIDILKGNGIKAALVNAGGEIKGFGKDWRIGIQDPRKEHELAAILELSEMSVATSGDYENYFIINNKRYHHLLNPLTGYPADELSSVSVISKSNLEADALSTAIFIMGKEKGLKIIESLPEIEAMIIDTAGLKSYSSDFKKYLSN